MKYWFLSLFALTAAIVPNAAAELDIRDYEADEVCELGTGQIQVTVQGVTAEGILAVELYRPSKRDFLKKASRIHRIRVAAQDGDQTVCFKPQGTGTYAVATYHDIDGDRDLDQKWNGMPKEPFGLSTNPTLKWGFPKFEIAHFHAPAEGTAISIQLVTR